MFYDSIDQAQRGFVFDDDERIVRTRPDLTEEQEGFLRDYAKGMILQDLVTDSGEGGDISDSELRRAGFIPIAFGEGELENPTPRQSAALERNRERLDQLMDGESAHWYSTNTYLETLRDEEGSVAKALDAVINARLNEYENYYSRAMRLNYASETDKSMDMRDNEAYVHIRRVAADFRAEFDARDSEELSSDERSSAGR